MYVPAEVVLQLGMRLNLVGLRLHLTTQLQKTRWILQLGEKFILTEVTDWAVVPTVFHIGEIPITVESLF